MKIMDLWEMEDQATKDLDHNTETPFDFSVFNF